MNYGFYFEIKSREKRRHEVGCIELMGGVGERFENNESKDCLHKQWECLVASPEAIHHGPMQKNANYEIGFLKKCDVLISDSAQ